MTESPACFGASPASRAIDLESLAAVGVLVLGSPSAKAQGWGGYGQGGGDGGAYSGGYGQGYGGGYSGGYVGGHGAPSRVRIRRGDVARGTCLKIGIT